MARKKKELNRTDEPLDELLSDCQSPEDILKASGLLKQLTKRWLEWVLAGELNHRTVAMVTRPKWCSQSRGS